MQEGTRCCKACKEHGTTEEFVLEETRAIASNPDHLPQQAATVKDVLGKDYA